jgi:hypothetical protein
LRRDAEDARRGATAEAEARRQAEQALDSVRAEQRAAEKMKAEAAGREAAALRRLEEERNRAAQPPPAAAPAPPVVPAWMNGTYTGLLTASTGGGPFLSMTFNATLTVADGLVTGEISERRCGVYRFSTPLPASGEFAGSIRFPEDGSCSASSADVTGKVAVDAIRIEIRAQRLKAYASLKKKS